jgi:hypothetical protein
MTEDCSFHVTLDREALRLLSVSQNGDGECEFSGSIGDVARIEVSEDCLVEIVGARGVLRFSAPSHRLRDLCCSFSGRQGRNGIVG